MRRSVDENPTGGRLLLAGSATPPDSQGISSTVHHLRTSNGDHEVDMIVEGDDRRVVGIEVELSPDISDRDVQHLHWLKERVGDTMADVIVVTTGKYAYRRPDSIGVVPASLLGP